MAEKKKGADAPTPPDETQPGDVTEPETAEPVGGIFEEKTADVPDQPGSALPKFIYFGSEIVLHNNKTGEDLTEHTFVADITRAGVMVRKVHVLRANGTTDRIVGVTVTHVPDAGIRKDQRTGVQSIGRSSF